jgi:hypothetical protein
MMASAGMFGIGKNDKAEAMAVVPAFYTWWYPDVYANAKQYVIDEVWNRGFWYVDQYINGYEIDYIGAYRRDFASSPYESFNINKVFRNIKKTKSVMDGYDRYLRGYIYWDNMYAEYLRLYYIIDNSILGSWYWNFNSSTYYYLQNEFCYGYLWY